MNENSEPTTAKLITTLDAGMDTLRAHYGDQYDVRMVPSVHLGGASHRCRCTIRVRHGEFSATSEGSYLVALLDALQQTLEAPQ